MNHLGVPGFDLVTWIPRVATPYGAASTRRSAGGRGTVVAMSNDARDITQNGLGLPQDCVREGGVEPPHPFGYTDLNRARLPIPPLARAGEG